MTIAAEVRSYGRRRTYFGQRLFCVNSGQTAAEAPLPFPERQSFCLSVVCGGMQEFCGSASQVRRMYSTARSFDNSFASISVRCVCAKRRLVAVSWIR